ncbi:MAG: maleylpyruvate isomerase N-terminal domain-containing protein [Acidobacteria bacterium]|nr:maleylpyruvate isomerase N-terminal domain-containing protein [Acidobacteriota bacterium]
MRASLRSITQADGVVISTDEFGAILDGQRQRFLRTFGAFDEKRWRQPTRCSRWDAHMVFRHLTDAAEVHLSGLTRVPARFLVDGGFDPNVTPGMWLAHSEEESPEATLQRYDRATRSIFDYAVAELPEQSDLTVTGPYGTAHWSTITTHILWDAWLHERDILLCDPTAAPVSDMSGTVDERRLVGMYASLMATLPALMARTPVQGTIALNDVAPVWVRFGGTGGAVEVHETPAGTDPEFEGDLFMVVDSLAGRGQPLHEVLTGPSDIVGSLAAFGEFLQG